MITPVFCSLRLSRRALFGGAATALLLPTAARAGTLKISVAEFPDNHYTPVLIEMVRYAATKTPGTSLEITTAPFVRSLNAAISGAADMHLPMLRAPVTEGLPFALTDAKITTGPFVLYTNKDKPLDMSKLHEEGKYKIETDVAHIPYFDIPLTGGASAESSLRKVDAGRIDGYVFAGTTCDPIVQAMGLNNLHRTLYRTIDVVGALPKAGQGGPADQWFSAAMAAVQNDQKFLAMETNLNNGYRGPDWQPG